MFRPSCHRGRLAADDPEYRKQGDYAGCDGEEVKVFSIHKAGRVLQPQVSRLRAESNKAGMGCQEIEPHRLA